MSDQMVVIVTGANRGIGRAICERILQTQPSLKLYATSRAGQDLGFKASKASQVIYPKLDVTDGASIKSLFSQIKDENNGKLDVLINNAGINTQPEHSPDSVKKTLDTNYRGTLDMCRTFLPLVSSSEKQGRIVNISSVGSSLHIYSKAVQQRFRNPNMTLKDLEQIAQEYQSDVEAGQEEAKGFGGKGQSYSVSKACVNALTAILARESQDKVLLNACCPGWVDTDMGGILGKPPKAPSDGAKIPVRLAFGDIDRTTGRYWANPGISDTGDGQVMEW